VSKLIESAWNSYQRQVLPTSAGDIQRTETRLAFYAGAAALFGGLANGVGDEDEPTADDLAMMDGIKAELDEWREEAKRRAARASR